MYFAVCICSMHVTCVESYTVFPHISSMYVYKRRPGCVKMRRALGYHNILLHAFTRLHGMQRMRALEREFQQSDEPVSTSTFLQECNSTELYKKMLRVKAFKACQFLRNEESLFQSFLCTTVVRKFEHVMFTLMKWQRDDFELTEFPPLVRMLDRDNSPVMTAIIEIKRLMTTGTITTGSTLTFHEVVRRHSVVVGC